MLVLPSRTSTARTNFCAISGGTLLYFLEAPFVYSSSKSLLVNSTFTDNLTGNIITTICCIVKEKSNKTLFAVILLICQRRRQGLYIATSFSSVTICYCFFPQICSEMMRSRLYPVYGRTGCAGDHYRRA